MPGATIHVERDESVRHAPPVARTLQPQRATILDLVRLETQPAVELRAFSAPACTVVGASGVIRAPDGRLIIESFADEEHRERFLSASVRRRRTIELAGSWAPVLSPWSQNYYHWLIDAFPKVAALHALDTTRTGVLAEGPMTDFQRQCLRATGETARQITENSEVTVERVVWAASPSPINFPTPETTGWLQRAILGTDRSRQASRRLYVRRSGSRRVANEGDLMRSLESLGIEPVQPETMSLEGQARLFSDADIIVGPHGAGMANVAFSREAKVLELFPPSRVAWHYYTLSAAAGAEYWYLVGSAGGRRRRDDSFTVDVDLVRATIEAMGSHLR